MARWVGAQGQVNSAIKEKHAPIMASPKKKQNEKTFFQSKLEVKIFHYRVLNGDNWTSTPAIGMCNTSSERSHRSF